MCLWVHLRKVKVRNLSFWLNSIFIFISRNIQRNGMHLHRAYLHSSLLPRTQSISQPDDPSQARRPAREQLSTHLPQDINYSSRALPPHGHISDYIHLQSSSRSRKNDNGRAGSSETLSRMVKLEVANLVKS